MEMMTLTINVKENTKAILEQKARSRGKDFAGYVEDLLEKDAEKAKTLDEILAPVRQNFAASGMSEEDLDELIESERQALWKEKQTES